MHPHLLTFVVVPLLAGAAAAQDPLVKQALSRIERVEQEEAKLAPGDQKTANLLLTDLAWAQKRLNAVGQGKDQHWQDAGARLTAVHAKVTAKAKASSPATGGDSGGAGGGYDSAKLAQLDKEIGNAIYNFGLLSRGHLQDSFRQRSVEKEIADFERRLAEFPADDAAVKQVAEQFRGFRTRFTDTMAQLNNDRAGSDAMARHLAELDAKYKDDAVPGELSYPYSDEQLRAWAAEVKRWRDTEIPQDVAFLTEAAQNAVVDQQHVSRLRHWLLDLRDRTLAVSTRMVAERLQSEVKSGLEVTKWILETDPKDQDQVTNRILGKGRFDENMTRLRDSKQAIAMSRLHDELMVGAIAPERDEQAASVDKAISHLKQLAVSTLAAVRMPATRSDDPELAKIAAETLKRPGYDVDGWLRLVVNTEKVRHESREAWMRPGAVTTTVSYYHYVWDQFQVTTAERHGDEVWLYANTLKRYESGDPTSKIGRWILSQRFELTRILPENVDG